MCQEKADIVREFLKLHNSNLSEYINQCFALAAKNIRDNDLRKPKEKLKDSEFRKILRMNDILLDKDDISPEAINRVKHIADKADISIKRLLKNIVEIGSEVLTDCGKVGVLQFIAILRNMPDTLKDWAKNVRSKKVEPL